ncbi:MAG TPA: hypothetical protein VG318_06825 [Actinomycetota bacterium]|nr:hypothetical protein [Actinomycetota bacterium]
MILGRHKGAAAGLAAAMFATVALMAAPAAHAATCVTVPGSTIGTDVSIAGQKARVPAISGIQVCAGTATAPIVSVQTSGGTCTFACLSVLLGGDVDAEGVSISYREDGVLRTVPVNPPPVDGPATTCLLSVGSPDAPYPDCFIAIGPELGNPVGDAQPVIDGAVDTALDAYADAIETAGDAYALACNRIPTAYDQYGYGYEFCDDAVGWTVVMTSGATEIACDAIPDMQDPYSGWSYSFCTDIFGWVDAAVDTVYCRAFCDDVTYTVMRAVCSQLERRDIYLAACNIR